MKVCTLKSAFGAAAFASSILLGMSAGAEQDADIIRAAWFRENITPEIGVNLGGYAADQKSVAKSDDLFACGLALDDLKGGKILLVAFDLLGLDGSYVQSLRKECAGILGIPETHVMLTCTHNHSGPESAHRFRLPGAINDAYLATLRKTTVEAVGKLAKGEWRPVRAGFGSIAVPVNTNRRYVSPANRCSYTPARRDLPTNGITDEELGLLLLWGTDPKWDGPAYVMGNYAAHGLAGRSPGVGGRRISADFPGVFRNYVSQETGAETMFVQGACGDLLPKHDEGGLESARRMGHDLGLAAMDAIIHAKRNQKHFIFRKTRVGGVLRKFESPIRKLYRGKLAAEYNASDVLPVEVQVIGVGDVCLVGIQGEPVCELGLEIKWHSPFRRAWVAAYALGYTGYVSPANFVIQGGYEGGCQIFRCRDTLRLVNEAVDAMYELHARLNPEMKGDDGEDYPDCLPKSPLVDL